MSQYEDFNKKYGNIIFIGSYIISGVSLICLSLVLFTISKHKIKKSILMTSLSIITISEIINCLSKLLNIFRQVVKPQNAQVSRSYWIIGQIQILFSLFSDSCTILSSFILTLKIYKTTLRHGLSFFNSKNIFLIVLLISLITPLVFSSTILSLNIIYYEGTASESETEYKVWAWIDCHLSLFVYSVVWFFIIVIMVLIGKTICYLNQRKKELLEESEDDEDTITKESLESSVLSSKIDSTVSKLYYFPIVTCAIWILLSIDRIPDDIININMTEEQQYVYKGNWLYLKYATIFLHNVIGSARGIIYCVTFFRVDSKLFNEIKNVLSCAWLCKKKERESTTINDITPNEAITFES